MTTIRDTITLIFPQRLLHTEHSTDYYHGNIAIYWQGAKEEYKLIFRLFSKIANSDY
jgi:hypothetical protein